MTHHRCSLQVTLNGMTARPSHQAEIETLFIDIRKCLIEVPNLSPAAKAFLVMTLDLYYNDFNGMGANLGTFYGKILDEHDNSERTKKLAALASTIKAKTTDTATKDDALNGENSFSLRSLRTDFANLQTSFKPTTGGGGGNGKGSTDHNTRINKEYLNRPLKANERLKYFQRNADSEPKTHRTSNADEKIRKPHSPIQRGGSSQNINQNDSEREVVSSVSKTDAEPTRTPPQTVPDNLQESAQPDSITSTSSDAPAAQEPPKFESTFNWFEAVENVTNDQFSNNNSFNNSGENNKFDTMSLASYSSNPVSPNERDDGGATSPRSFRNRSRRNSLNRFRSEYYKKSNESLNQPPEFDRVSNRSLGRNNNNRPGNNHLNSNFSNQQSWRNSGRNSPRNGYHRRGGGGGAGGGGTDFDRDGRDANNFRRNLSRGGSVDSNIKDFQHGPPVGNRNRHDSFNRRNQENDNFEHFHSYNRKSHSRNKNTFLNNSQLPPRLQAQQQKLAQMKLQQQQQQQQQYNNDCDNPKRFNNRNNQTSSNVGTASNKGKYPAKDLQSVGGGNGSSGGAANNNENRRDNDI